MKRLFLTIALACMVGAIRPVSAQEVKREGKVFVEQKQKRQAVGKNDTKTDYTYRAKDGKVYPIYLSKNGKAFIVRVSKNGNEYRQYLPKVTEELSKNK